MTPEPGTTQLATAPRACIAFDTGLASSRPEATIRLHGGVPRVVHRHRRLRRFVNIVIALVALILLAPLMLLIALLVKSSSPGPALYRQTRIGVDRRKQGVYRGNGRRKFDMGGKPFQIYKFRTMTVSGRDARQVWATPNDPRVTPLGRVLRRYRMDELPQLINVLRGEMNIVGPRPEQPQIFTDLCDQIERYRDRQMVLPGITGWAQVNQHYDLCVEDVRAKLRYDLEYIERQSLRQDLRILLRTLPVMIFQRGSL